MMIRLGYNPTGNIRCGGSIKMNGARPYLDVSEGERVINIWMREDGMRIDRVLLTRQVGYNPTGNIRCGGY